MPRVLSRLTRGRVVVGVAVLALLGGGTALAATRPWHHPRSKVTTEVVTAKRTTIVQTVSASGTVEPAKQADLDFAVAGRVTRVLVKVGDVVTKGQALATVGAAALRAERAAAAATVVADGEKVAADSSGSAQQAADEAALTAARSARHTANLDLAAATLKATFGGTVAAVNLSVGQQVSGGSAQSPSQSGDSTAQVSIQSTSTFVVDATVDDTEVSQVKKGEDVAVTPTGASQAVAGTVTSVTMVPSSSSGVVSFPVTVALTGHPQDVYAGSSATLSITTGKAVNVLAIPTLAITYDGSTATVQVKTGSGTETRTITVGQTYGQQTAVKSGLTAGEQIVVSIPTFAQITSGVGNGGSTSPFGGDAFTGVPPGGSAPFSQSFGGG